MNLFKTLSIAFLTFNAFSSFAQIQKGNYSLGGDIGLSGNLQRSEFYRSIDARGSISPLIGEFITDKWFLSLRPMAQIVLSENDFNVPNSGVSGRTSTGHGENLGLDIGSRYYFAAVKNAHFFGLANLALSKNWNTFNNAGRPSFTYSSRLFNYGLGIGANVFLNPEVAFETTLSYRQNDINTSVAGSQGFTSNSKFGIWNLNVELNNFIDFSARKERKETPQYIKKGRQILGGQANLTNYRFDGRSQTIFSFAPQFSQFVTNNILLKGSFAWRGYTEDGRYNSTNAAVEARYYVPIGKRFFIYPQFNASFLAGDNDFFIASTLNETPPNTWRIGLGVGGSYFLSENVAIDASFFQANMYSGKSSARYFTGLLGVGNVGLLYFIR